MKSTSALFLVIALILRTSPIAGQAQPAKACGLFGTWRFIEIVDWDSVGTPIHFYGEHPGGYLIYTATGQVSVHLASDTTGAPGAQTSYFGTFATARDCRAVVHIIEGGTDPGLTGTAEPRPFQLRGDTLTLGDGRTWRRRLVRVRGNPTTLP